MIYIRKNVWPVDPTPAEIAAAAAAIRATWPDEKQNPPAEPWQPSVYSELDLAKVIDNPDAPRQT
jgi:hypothetical protein